VPSTRDALSENCGVLELDLPSEDRVLAAARLKARHPMAYADAFAVATAVAHSAELLTPVTQRFSELMRTGDSWTFEGDGPDVRQALHQR